MEEGKAVAGERREPGRAGAGRMLPRVGKMSAGQRSAGKRHPRPALHAPGTRASRANRTSVSRVKADSPGRGRGVDKAHRRRTRVFISQHSGQFRSELGMLTHGLEQHPEECCTGTCAHRRVLADRLSFMRHDETRRHGTPQPRTGDTSGDVQSTERPLARHRVQLHRLADGAAARGHPAWFQLSVLNQGGRRRAARATAARATR